MKVKIDPRFRELIPPLASEELSQLEANILSDGCRDALVCWDGVILDGHNRFDICQKHGLGFTTVSIELPDEDAALDWIDTNQLGRRNLNPDQKSYIRGRLYNRKKKAAHGRSGRTFSECQSDTPKDTASAIAEANGVSRRTIIRDGKRAEAIDKLSETQPEEAKAVKYGIKKFNEIRRALKLEKVKAVAKLPDSKYRVIYADPPWKYPSPGPLCEMHQYGGVKYHYPQMSVEELCALPIKSLAEDDSVLFLWITSPLLFIGAPIIQAWGFEYKTSFVWDKIKHNMGHYNSVRHEFLLICTRGSCTPDNPKLFDSVQSIERHSKHSRKPEEFRLIIDTLYPHGKRLELFGRGKAAKGWEIYGNQID